MKHVLANETARISIIVGVIKFVTSSQSNDYIPGLYVVTVITKKSTKKCIVIREKRHFNIKTTKSKHELELRAYLKNIRRNFRLKTRVKIGDDLNLVKKSIKQITQEYISIKKENKKATYFK